MIDWEKRCIELAEIVNRHRKDRMHVDMHLAWKMATKLLKVQKIQQLKILKWKEYNSCPDRKKRDKLWDEYMDLVRAMELEVNK